MSCQILVTNKEPETTTDVAKPLLHLFQQYSQKKYNQSYAPFIHQAKVFRLVGEENKPVELIAGTAAGKTLAIGIPLFHKLQTGQIKRILLMYPTIALMNDQRRVMDTLAELTHLEVGHIQGGMTHSQVISALNKPVILATPDAIYWFFQKNVKYGGLLLYGLSLVDEWVLDEAHLFNGLMLQNLRYLKERITHLAELVGRKPHWHILTATPSPELKALTGGVPIDGASKCGDVTVSFVKPPAEYKERDDIIQQLIEDALALNKRKVLAVFNSARAAHILFNHHKNDSPVLNAEQGLRFGSVPWKEIRIWLQENNLGAAIKPLETWLGQGKPFRPADLQKGQTVSLPTDKLVASLTSFLEDKIRLLIGIAYEASRNGQLPVTVIKKQLSIRGNVIRALWKVIGTIVEGDVSAEEIKTCLYKWIADVTDRLDRQWGDSIQDTSPEFRRLQSELNKAGLGADLAELAVRYLIKQVSLSSKDLNGVFPKGANLDKQSIPLRWLAWVQVIPDRSLREEITVKLKAALENHSLTIETPYITTWGNIGIPTILYSGKMSKYIRNGLIELFNVLDRAILISTPAVEVGVDFRVESLITEECDGPGFLQRLGRVGRSGEIGEVFVLLRNPEIWPRLRNLSPEMSREEFSSQIVNPNHPTDATHSLFPARSYVPDSSLVGATHWLVNRQIGAIGQRLNQAMFATNTETVRLAETMQTVGVPFRYGLRGTLPEIALRGEAGGDPFYVLSRVHNGYLRPATSPFEAAWAEMSYGRFIYLPFGWQISVDWEKTVDASEFFFYRLDGKWEVAGGSGIVRDYIQANRADYADLVKPARQLWHENPEQARNLLNSQRHQPRFDVLARLGPAILLPGTPNGHLLLGQGPVYLQREDESGLQPIETEFGEAIFLPDQMWLMMWGNKNEALTRLDKSDLRGREELHIDDRGQFVILIEQLAGACMYAYERLRDVG